MKTFYLVKLWFSHVYVMAEIEFIVIQEAIEFFQRIHPEFKLNDHGYAKDGEFSYCVAERYESFTSLV